MASRILNLSLFTTKQITSSVLSRSYTSLPFYTGTSSLSSLSNFSLFRLRPLVAVAANLHRVSPTSTTIRGFATRQTTSSLNDSSPNWSNRPPKETILLDGCDFEHWLVVMEKPENDPTRDEIIDSYIKTLAMVLGSEEEARMKIYSVSTRCYFAFGALVSEEISYKIKELPKVRWVLPDSYLDVRNKDYGGEPFINGQAVPYDPKYHEEWIRNNARAGERNRRNDRPRNFDRSRNFERRRENLQNRPSGQGMQNPGPNMGAVPQSNVAPNMGGGPPHGNTGGGPPHGSMGGGPPNNMGGGLPGNMGGGPLHGNMGGGPLHGNMGGGPPGNMGGGPTSYMGGGPPGDMGGSGAPNMGAMQHSNMGRVPNNGGMPPNNTGGPLPSNIGGNTNNMPNFQHRNGPNSVGIPYESGPGPNTGNQNSYAPNTAGGTPPNYQTRDMPGRDMPPPPYYK